MEVLLNKHLSHNQSQKILSVLQEYADADEVFYDLLGKLEQGVAYNDLLTDLKEGRWKWRSSHFALFRKRRRGRDDQLLYPPELKEGEMPCPHCKSLKTIMVVMQLRSADEGCTYILSCYNPKCKQVTK